jgi:hypothetical protein
VAEDLELEDRPLRDLLKNKWGFEWLNYL